MEIEKISVEEYNKKYGTIFKKYRSGNKYGAKKVIIDNKKFDSQSEAGLYNELILQKYAGTIKDIELQVKEDLWAYGVHICNYYVDFKIIHCDGSIEYIEHKSSGTITDSWRIKFKILKAKYKNDPNVKININWYRGYKIKKY